MDVLTVWFALDDCDAENGCMRVIPGSHKQGDMRHREVDEDANNLLVKEVAPECFDASRAVDAVLKAGECSLHLPWLVHGSSPNNSPRRRAGLPVRYMRTTPRVF